MDGAIMNANRSESNEDKFKRLAERRTNILIEGFRKLGNLSNKRNYEYTDEQIRKIFSALTKELNKTKKLFQQKGNSTEHKFKL